MLEWVASRSLLTSTSAANPSAGSDSSLCFERVKRRSRCARCGTTAPRSGVSGVESAGLQELLGAVRGLSDAQGAPMTRPAAAHTDAPARSAGQRHQHGHAANSTGLRECGRPEGIFVLPPCAMPFRSAPLHPTDLSLRSCNSATGGRTRHSLGGGDRVRSIRRVRPCSERPRPARRLRNLGRRPRTARPWLLLRRAADLRTPRGCRQRARPS